jgi:hypothetical protein
MSNPNAAFGLVPIRHLSGAPYNDQANEYYVASGDSNALYIGDLVKSVGTCNSSDGTPIVTKASAGNNVRGVVVGFRPVLTNLTLNYHVASTAQYVLVADDPHLVCKVQEDSVGGSIAASSGINDNYDFVYAAGSTVTGISGSQLDSSTVTSSSAGLRVIRLYRDNQNAIGTNAIWEVFLNKHEFFTTSGT